MTIILLIAAAAHHLQATLAGLKAAEAATQGEQAANPNEIKLNPLPN